MVCDWASFLSLVPGRFRTEVDRLGKEGLQELRLRLGQAPELVLRDRCILLDGKLRPEDLSFTVNAASRYSPWASESVTQGYLTGAGGHRVGLCGDVAIHDGKVRNIRTLGSLCIRVAREFHGLAKELPTEGPLLILGSPGSGKTTLLRDLVRLRANSGTAVAVVDERGELFPPGFDRGQRTDVLTGCPKAEGIEMVLRTMGPGCIAVDEITADRDCEALIQAAWCGVDLLATAHAASVKDLLGRSVYRQLVNAGIFRDVVIMNRDKSWRRERMYL